MFLVDYFVDWFQNLPPELSTFILAMIPLTELRVSIPVALEVYKLPVHAAFFWSVLGDLVPAILILKFIGPVSDILRKHSRLADRFFVWLFKRTRKKFSSNYSQYGALALVIFVGIPLPVTGSWTGSIAAFLFNISFKKALILIFLGVSIAGVIVTLVSTGVFSFLH